MIDNDEYELRMQELSSTINGRLSAVISKQAQTIVGNTYQSSQFKLQSPIPANFNSRTTSIENEILKLINPPSVTVKVVPSIVVTDGKVTLSVTATCYLYKSKTDKIEIASNIIYADTRSVLDYVSLRKYVSQITSGSVSNVFASYLNKANDGLDVKIEKIIVYVLDNIEITRDNSILSTTVSSVKSNTTRETDVQNTPISGEGTNTKDDTSPEKLDDTSSSKNNNKKTNTDFLDIESVDQLLTRDNNPTSFLSLKLGNDTGELLTRDDDGTTVTEQRDVKSLQQTTSTDEDVVEPTSAVELNKQQQLQYNQQLQITEAQRLAEFSDALLKEKAKPKSSITPAGTNENVQSEGGRESASESATDKHKPKEKLPTNPMAKYFRDWAKGDGSDPNGIIYRGTKDKDYRKGTIPKNTYGLVYRYKNLFNWGLDLGSIFSGHTILSPIDVSLLLNSGTIGRFNKNIPYMFEEGCEIHLAITRSDSVSRKDEGGVGVFNTTNRDYLDANWASNPHWCGLFTNFVLFTNGVYKSDSNLANIVATGAIVNLYKSSPFNTIPVSISKRQRSNLEKRLDELKSDTTGTNDTEIKNIEDTLNNTIAAINEQNSCALLKRGIHWTDNRLLPDGSFILNKISQWPGAFVVRRTRNKSSGHVEVLLHITKTGMLYTIGGNTGLKDSNGNGSEYGIKKYVSISEFCGSGYDEFYIYKRGTLLPYTNGIGVSVRKTETYNKYVRDLDSDTELCTATYNILREIMEV